MAGSKRETRVPASPQAPAELRFREALALGKHWYLALLEALGFWDRTEETVQGRTFCYLLDGEAFDWLLVARRLCAPLDGLIPQDELDCLLLHGRPPLEVPRRRLKELLGGAKYRACLNYFYGVEVELALQQAVTAEIRKEARPFPPYPSASDTAFQRIYGLSREELWMRFQEERGYLSEHATEMDKEFTYWLFKYRLCHCESALVASDTQKGLAFLRGQGRAFLLA